MRPRAKWLPNCRRSGAICRMTESGRVLLVAANGTGPWSAINFDVQHPFASPDHGLTPFGGSRAEATGKATRRLR